MTVNGDIPPGAGCKRERPHIAARLQGLAAAGEVAVSRMVRDNADGKIDCVFEDLGEHNVKNIDRALHVFAVRAAEVESERATVDRSRKPSICVLPFANMSGDSEQEYFSDGITEDIITDLSKISALGVAARHTSFQFKGKNMDVRRVAQQLSVSHVLEGSVRKVGGRVRITAQLIDGVSGEHAWADRYDRDLNDIFELQDEISKAIVTVLKLKLLPKERMALGQRGATNVDAYELFLLARQFHRTGSERMKPLILRLCRRVVALDPDFAQGWALMAMAEAEGCQRRVPGFSFESAKAAAESAITLAPLLAEAHAALGDVLIRVGMDIASSREPIETALNLDPNCYDARLLAGYLRLAQKRYEESIENFEAAIAIDPEAYQPAGMVLQVYTAAGNRAQGLAAAERSLALCEKILHVEPDHGGALGFIVASLVHLGEVDRARAWAKRAILFDPDNLRMHYNVACSLVTLQDREAAISLLADLLPKVHAGWVGWMRVDTDLDAIRDDPRFAAMLEEAETRLATEHEEAVP